LRPRAVMPGNAATFEANAGMPGNFAMSAQAKANWPESMPEFGTVNSPLKQAEDREKAELKAQLEALKAQNEKMSSELNAKNQRRANMKAQRQQNMAKAREAAKAKREVAAMSQPEPQPEG